LLLQRGLSTAKNAAQHFLDGDRPRIEMALAVRIQTNLTAAFRANAQGQVGGVVQIMARLRCHRSARGGDEDKQTADKRSHGYPYRASEGHALHGKNSFRSQLSPGLSAS